MPIKVKTPSTYGLIDDTDDVPSLDDFNDLESSVSKLARKVTVLASKISAIDRSVKAVEKSIEKQRCLHASLRRDMSKELASGEWKRIIEKTVNESVKALEVALRRLGASEVSMMSTEAAKRMSNNSATDVEDVGSVKIRRKALRHAKRCTA